MFSVFTNAPTLLAKYFIKQLKSKITKYFLLQLNIYLKRWFWKYDHSDMKYDYENDLWNMILWNDWYDMDNMILFVTWFGNHNRDKLWWFNICEGLTDFIKSYRFCLL